MGYAHARIFNALNLRCSRIAAARAIQGVVLSAECQGLPMRSCALHWIAKSHLLANHPRQEHTARGPRLEGQILIYRDASGKLHQDRWAVATDKMIRQEPRGGCRSPSPVEMLRLIDRQEDRPTSHRPGRGDRVHPTRASRQINRQDHPTRCTDRMLGLEDRRGCSETRSQIVARFKS